MPQGGDDSQTKDGDSSKPFEDLLANAIVNSVSCISIRNEKMNNYCPNFLIIQCKSNHCAVLHCLM